MSIYNPLSSSYDPKMFLDYKLFNVTSSIPVSSSERTPTSSAQLTSGSVFLLSASAAFTAGLNVQTEVKLVSYVYNRSVDSDTDPSGALHNTYVDRADYKTINSINNGYVGNITRGQETNVAQFIEGPIRITTGSSTSQTTGSIRIGFGRTLRIKDGENFTVNLGCTDSNALNYNPSANLNDGSCILPVYGCTNPNSVNYNPAANVDDGSCAIAGCTDPTAINYNPLATTENGTCQYVVGGDYINTNDSTTHIDNSYTENTITTLSTNGSILIQTNGIAYVGPYHITTNSPQIYVAGPTPSNVPNAFVDGNILILRNGNRRYTDDNTPISNNLPSAYGKPVSQEQLCSNCYFNQNGNCTKWNAEVRMDYWCAKYKPIDILTPAGDTFRSDFPGVVQTGLTTAGNEFLLNDRSFYVGSYRIMPDGTYFADDTLPFRKLTLKQTLKFGPNKHFTKVNKNQQGMPTVPVTTQPTTSPTVSTETTVAPPSETGTSYSY